MKADSKGIVNVLSSITFTRYGRVPSKSNFRRGGKDWRKKWAAITAFQEEIGILALQAGARPLYRKMAVEVQATLIGQRLDVDNAGKAILDGLEGVCYENDSQVFRWLVEEFHDEYSCSPRLELTVTWYSKIPSVNSGNAKPKGESECKAW